MKIKLRLMKIKLRLMKIKRSFRQLFLTGLFGLDNILSSIIVHIALTIIFREFFRVVQNSRLKKYLLFNFARLKERL
jgi:hypothetical protein